MNSIVGPIFNVYFAEKKRFVGPVNNARDPLKAKMCRWEAQNVLPKRTLYLVFHQYFFFFFGEIPIMVLTIAYDYFHKIKKLKIKNLHNILMLFFFFFNFKFQPITSTFNDNSLSLNQDTNYR